MPPYQTPGLCSRGNRILENPVDGGGDLGQFGKGPGAGVVMSEVSIYGEWPLGTQNRGSYQPRIIAVTAFTEVVEAQSTCTSVASPVSFLFAKMIIHKVLSEGIAVIGFA